MGHAEGYLTHAIGPKTHTEGEGTSAVGVESHAEGHYNIVTGTISHVEGGNNSLGSWYSHVEGNSNTLEGPYGAGNHGEGGFNKIWSNPSIGGNYNHIEGSYNQILSGLNNCHVEGLSCIAAGEASHAAGYQSIAAHARTYIWSSNGASTTNSNQFMVSATNGVVLGNGININGELTVNSTVSSGTFTITDTMLSLTINGSALWLPLYR